MTGTAGVDGEVPTAFRVFAYVPDLMDRSRIDAAAKASGVSIVFLRVPEAIAHIGDGQLRLLVDLGRPGVLEALRALVEPASAATAPTGELGEPRIVGFASHVDRDLMRAARRAGCSTVLARSAFFTRVAEFFAAPS